MNDHPAHSFHSCIDAYEDPPNLEQWDECPACKLKPKVWIFNNGNSTACGCARSTYDHFSVHAESIASVLKRTGGFAKYCDGDLMNNWNTWCRDGVIVFEHAGKRNDGRW